MSQSLEQEIVALQDLQGSSRDPNGRAFVPLADAYRRSGEFDTALELLREGLTRHPEYTSAHVVASWVHIDRGAFDEALGTLELVLELDQDNRAGLKGLGRVLHEKGDREGAIGHLSRLAELEPEDAEARSLLETIQAAEPVAVPEADEEIVTATMGDVYASQGLFDQAVEVYEQLVAEAPDDDGLAARLEELRAEASAPLVADDAPDGPQPTAIDALAPEPVATTLEDAPPISIDALAPDEVAAPAMDDRPTVPIGSLAPEGERPVVPIMLLAPDDVSATAAE